MKPLYRHPESLSGTTTIYCPGCGHGLVQKLIAEVIDELGVREKTVAVAPVGCAVLSYDYFNFDVTEAAHGRAPAVATAIRRVLPGAVVFTYQGDGDLAAIGAAEIVHAAARGETFSVFFVNNATYGMTKGQMAPTTLPGQKTTTSVSGRKVSVHGYPVRVAELLSQLDGAAYIERTTTSSIEGIAATKRAVRKAFRCQLDRKGFSLVEILATCPTNWKLAPGPSLAWMKREMEAFYRVGVVKETAGPNP